MGTLIKVATLGDLVPGTCRQVAAAGRVFAIFNVDGTILAIGGTCTHRGGPLGEGKLDGTVVTCPWHGTRFDVRTAQILGPPAGQDVPAYPVVLEGQDIEVDLPEGAA